MICKCIQILLMNTCIIFLGAKEIILRYLDGFTFTSFVLLLYLTHLSCCIRFCRQNQLKRAFQPSWHTMFAFLPHARCIATCLDYLLHSCEELSMQRTLLNRKNTQTLAKHSHSKVFKLNIEKLSISTQKFYQ